MKKQWLIFILTLSIFNACSKKSNDDKITNNNCPKTNTSRPEIIGDWKFTGTKINDELIVEDCDLQTTLKVTESQFTWNNYSDANCSTLTIITNCYSIENNNEIVYYDEFGNTTGFSQKILTLNSTNLILQNPSNGVDLVTENYEKL
ncbi:MAG: hypothetical protein R2812_00495 [Gelidibacter sp.]